MGIWGVFFCFFLCARVCGFSVLGVWGLGPKLLMGWGFMVWSFRVSGFRVYRC